HYYKMLKRAKLPTMPLHRLRHTAATRLDSVKATEACKAAILGHGPATVTGGYIHVSLDDKRQALIESEHVMYMRWREQVMRRRRRLQQLYKRRERELGRRERRA